MTIHLRYLVSTLLAYVFLSGGYFSIAMAKTEPKFIMLTHAGAGDPFWATEFKGAKMAAKQLGVKLQIQTPETPNDIARQVELLLASISTRPDGIAMTLPNDKAFVAPLRQAKKLGIPIVIFNARPGSSSSDNDLYMSYVGMDDYIAGRRAAQKALKEGQLSKRVVVANHQPGQIGLEKRAKGINDILKEHEIQVDKLDITSDATKAISLLRGHLKKYPETTGVFCLGAGALHAVAKMLEKEHRGLFLASFDTSPLTLKYIKQGLVRFTIDQQPFMQGHMAISQLALYHQYKLNPTDIDTGSGIVDQNNWKEIWPLVSKGFR